jgi:predicted amidohydrolase
VTDRMRLCIAQTRPVKGDVPANIDAHLRFIDLASTLTSDAIFFPELSLTGYEPDLADTLATHPEEDRFAVFQEASDRNKIIIGLGMPIRTDSKPRIGMILFEPFKRRQTYFKQLLHSDELPYFECGVGQVIIHAHGRQIAPAICYESLQPTHSDNAFKLGADVYVASVAKPANGVLKAFDHFPKLAKRHAVPVLMSNSVGFCDNFLSVGQSSVWSKEGHLVGQLDDKTEGLLMFDTETEELVERYLNHH